jgi:hypothetical protein
MTIPLERLASDESSSGYSSTPEFNRAAAALLRQCATLLTRQQANPFRARAYSRAADSLEGFGRDVRDVLAERGIEGIMELPGIGPGLATAIVEISKTGRLSRLDRLRGDADPETLFRMVPAIGPELARLIHEHLHVSTLEELEIAAHDGRLQALPGIGARRVAAIRAGLAALLGRASGRARPLSLPPVEVILDVDREYRSRAAANALPKIAPRRFNPNREAWLPVLHTQRGDWHLTALYSNTAQAHRLGRTRDWVVVYFHDGEHREAQSTVVTETRGSMTGRRVVRGRERECTALVGPHAL